MRRCTINGCTKPHKARGLCNGHYVRWFRTGGTGDATFRPRRDGCRVDGCDRDHLARGYCSTHYQRVRTHGEAGAAEIRSGISSYSGAHALVERLHGPASEHQCRHCGKPAAEWAYDHSDPEPLFHPKYGSPYSTDPGRYMPLCKPCHLDFDAHPFVASTKESSRQTA